jgi:hypothetical protein
MSGSRRKQSRIKVMYGCALVAATTFGMFAQAQSLKKVDDNSAVKDKLIGAWRLVHIDAPGPDGTSLPVPQPIGMLVYTRDGHMSVQLMYPESAKAQSNEYLLNG